MSKFKIFTGELYTDIIPYRVEMKYNEKRRLNLFEMFWIVVIQNKGENQDYLQLTLEQLIQRANLEPNLAYAALEELVNTYKYLTVGEAELSVQLPVANLEFSKLGMAFVGKTPEQMQILPEHGKKLATLPEPQGILMYYNSLTQQAHSEAFAYGELPRNVREPKVSGNPQYPATTNKLQSLYISNQSGILGSINQQPFDGALVRQVLEHYLSDNINKHPWYNDKVELVGEPEWQQIGDNKYQRIEYALVYDSQERKFELEFTGSPQERLPYQQWLEQQKFAGNNLWYYLVRSQVGAAQALQIETTLDWSRVEKLQPAVVARSPAPIKLIPQAGSELREWQLLDENHANLQIKFTLAADVVRQIKTALCSLRSSQATWYYDQQLKQVCVRSLGRITHASFYNEKERELDVVVIAKVPEITGEMIFTAVREEFTRQYQELATASTTQKTALVETYLQQLRYLAQHFIGVEEVIAEISQLVRNHELKIGINYVASYVQQVPSNQRAQWRTLTWLQLLPRPTSFNELALLASLLPTSAQLERDYLQSPTIRRELFFALLEKHNYACELVAMLDDSRFQGLAQIITKLYGIEHLRNVIRQASSNLELRVTKFSSNNVIQLQALLVFLRDYFPEYTTALQATPHAVVQTAQNVGKLLAHRWQQAQRVAVVTYDYLVTCGARDLLALERRFHQVIIVENSQNRFIKEHQRCVDKQNRNDYNGPDEVVYVENILKTQELLGKPGLLASMRDISTYCDLIQTQLDKVFDEFQIKQRQKFEGVNFTLPALAEYKRIIACAQYYKAHQVYVFASEESKSSDQLLTNFLRDTVWHDEHIQVVHDIPMQLELLDSEGLHTVSRLIPEVAVNPLEVFNLQDINRLGDAVDAYYGVKIPTVIENIPPSSPAPVTAQDLVTPHSQEELANPPIATTQNYEVGTSNDGSINTESPLSFTPSSNEIILEDVSLNNDISSQLDTSEHTTAAQEQELAPVASSAEVSLNMQPQEWRVDNLVPPQESVTPVETELTPIELNGASTALPLSDNWSNEAHSIQNFSLETQELIQKCISDITNILKLNSGEWDRIMVDFKNLNSRYKVALKQKDLRMQNRNRSQIRQNYQNLRKKYPENSQQYSAVNNRNMVSEDPIVANANFGGVFK